MRSFSIIQNESPVVGSGVLVRRISTAPSQTAAMRLFWVPFAAADRLMAARDQVQFMGGL